MTDIPKARSILAKMLLLESDDTIRAELREALSLMTRKPSPRRKVTSAPMTPELAQQARELHEATDMNQKQIGDRLRVNPGRVSEAINGLR